MIGIDTNLLVRFILSDDEPQTGRVHALLRKSRLVGESVFISTVILCETAWLLKSACSLRKDQILNLLEGLLEIDAFVIDEEAAVRNALRRAQSGPADFAEYLIGEINLVRNCRFTVTFDRALRNSPAYSVL